MGGDDAAAASRRAKGRSGAVEAFFRTDGESAPLLVVYHVQKTAGTSLRHVVRANLPPAEAEMVSYLHKSARTPPELLAWHEQWYRSLDADRRSRLCCVMSHWAGYLLPVLDRPVDALVLVREPVDRTLSYYWFKQRRRGPERLLEPLERLYEHHGTRSDGQKRPELWEQLCNWQSRALLSVFHDVSTLSHSHGPGPDADLWRRRLRELVERVFYVGVQDRFVQYLELLERRYGWRTFVPHSKVNAARSAGQVSPALRGTILAHNWLDLELYELCRAAQLEREQVLEEPMRSRRR
jgi:hypothetical protein